MKALTITLIFLMAGSTLAQSPWCGIWVCHKFTANSRDEAWNIARTAEAWIFLDFELGQDRTLGPYVFEELYPLNPNYPVTLERFNLTHPDLISMWARVDLPSLGRTGEWYVLPGAFALGPVELKSGLFLISNVWAGEQWAPWRWEVEFHAYLLYRPVPEPSLIALLFPLTLTNRRKRWQNTRKS